MASPDTVDRTSALVVLASPEPTSFAAALARTAAAVCEARGWATTLLDLYAERFDPALSANDFTERCIPGRLQPMDEQAHAATIDGFAPELQRHITLFRGADLVLLVSPMWWFSVPAMMKGWIDRVLANGVAYHYPDIQPWTGPLTTKRGMLILTSSYEENSFRSERVGTLRQVLHPLLHGTLAYTRMQVLEPFVASAADSIDDEARQDQLAALQARLWQLPSG